MSEIFGEKQNVDNLEILAIPSWMSAANNKKLALKEEIKYPSLELSSKLNYCAFNEATCTSNRGTAGIVVLIGTFKNRTTEQSNVPSLISITR